MLLHYTIDLVLRLTKIFNDVLESGTFPKPMAEPLIIGIPLKS